MRRVGGTWTFRNTPAAQSEIHRSFLNAGEMIYIVIESTDRLHYNSTMREDDERFLFLSYNNKWGGGEGGPDNGLELQHCTTAVIEFLLSCCCWWRQYLDICQVIHFWVRCCTFGVHSIVPSWTGRTDGRNGWYTNKAIHCWEDYKWLVSLPFLLLFFIYHFTARPPVWISSSHIWGWDVARTGTAKRLISEICFRSSEQLGISKCLEIWMRIIMTSI